MQKPQFHEGIDWLEMAANANSFTAQGILIALYAANLGPTEDPVEAAKWAHLYLSNPVRLNLGVPVLAQVSIDTLRDGMDKQNWLAGEKSAALGACSRRHNQPVSLYQDRTPSANPACQSGEFDVTHACPPSCLAPHRPVEPHTGIVFCFGHAKGSNNQSALPAPISPVAVFGALKPILKKSPA